VGGNTCRGCDKEETCRLTDYNPSWKKNFEWKSKRPGKEPRSTICLFKGAGGGGKATLEFKRCSLKTNAWGGAPKSTRKKKETITTARETCDGEVFRQRGGVRSLKKEERGYEKRRNGELGGHCLQNTTRGDFDVREAGRKDYWKKHPESLISVPEKEKSGAG